MADGNVPGVATPGDLRRREVVLASGPHDVPGAVDASGALDDALARLDHLDSLATPAHVEVLEAVHEALVADLARSED
ncbi:hypothetical protein [Cellulosimicrobium sp. Marseille-Q4280]|uniref:hypothetical protein n=1 Tax=Cellulosimicrobium sp. Marseille-Q4280 TaxID=2937992 RepID=UPI00203D5722|nr:hypothetical protein [Cellulosimicrobium sp. Marseille-Q4280]